MNHKDLLENLKEASELGTEMIRPYLPIDVEYLDFYAMSTFTRNESDPTLFDIRGYFFLLSDNAITSVVFTLEAAEQVSTEYRTETRRLAKSTTSVTRPIGQIQTVTLSSSGGQFRGHTTEPPERDDLLIEFGEGDPIRLPVGPERTPDDDVSVKVAGDVRRFALAVSSATGK